jgi:hypothetical protein
MESFDTHVCGFVLRLISFNQKQEILNNMTLRLLLVYIPLRKLPALVQCCLAEACNFETQTENHMRLYLCLTIQTQNDITIMLCLSAEICLTKNNGNHLLCVPQSLVSVLSPTTSTIRKHYLALPSNFAPFKIYVGRTNGLLRRSASIRTQRVGDTFFPCASHTHT